MIPEISHASSMLIDDFGGIRTVRLGCQILTRRMALQLDRLPCYESRLTGGEIDPLGRVSMGRNEKQVYELDDRPSQVTFRHFYDRTAQVWFERRDKPYLELLVRWLANGALFIWEVGSWKSYRDFLGDRFPEELTAVSTAGDLPLILLP